MTSSAAKTGYAPVNGLNLYNEIHGSGQPLVLLQVGPGQISMFGEVLAQLAATWQVIAADLQAHGRTADIDRPIRYELMADGVAALIRHLGITKTDIMGYSLGAGRRAIPRPAHAQGSVIRCECLGNSIGDHASKQPIVA